MRFEELLEIVGAEPTFETGLLLAGDVAAQDVRLQLSRWTRDGRLFQLRRGLYALAPPYQKTRPHPFLLANRLQRSSYVSLQSGLAYYGLIPEYVPVVTSVTAGRPGRRDTPLGLFEFRHVKPGFFRGYRLVDLGGGQQAFVASPEKALLDTIYLEPDSDQPQYLQGLRLQNLDQLNLEDMVGLARCSNSTRVDRAIQVVAQVARADSDAWEPL